MGWAHSLDVTAVHDTHPRWSTPADGLTPDILDRLNDTLDPFALWLIASVFDPRWSALQFLEGELGSLLRKTDSSD